MDEIQPRNNAIKQAEPSLQQTACFVKTNRITATESTGLIEIALRKRNEAKENIPEGYHPKY
jgi:hypothetical protein